MVAARRRELAFPLRWYSIPNLFRYEQPQRGRLREHWQLNVDIFGADSAAAEIEVIGMACDITRAYGLGNKDFEVRINNRELMNHLMKNVFHLDNETAHKLSKLIDKKAKMPREKFIEAIEEIVGDSSASSRCIELLEAKDIETFEKLAGGSPNGVNGGTIAGLDRIREVINGLKKLDQLNRLDQTEVNIRFDPTLMRGFDYYTGIIFEIFDLNPNNRRSIFGGGRYDDLLSLFGNEKVTAVGFGAGDVIARDLMETYSTLEKFTHAHTPADVSICLIGNDNATHDYAFTVAKILRQQNICTSIDFSNKKTGDKIAAADKRRIPFVIVIGDEEIKSNQIVLKKLATKEEKLFNSAEFKDIGNYIKNKKCAP
jgi:histidyl-tRNA synthetase